MVGIVVVVVKASPLSYREDTVMETTTRVRVKGPLAVYAAGFREDLGGLAYTDRSAQAHLLLWQR